MKNRKMFIVADLVSLKVQNRATHTKYKHFPRKLMFSKVFKRSCKIFMPPTLEKLKGHIAFGLSVRVCVRPSVRPLQNLLRYSFEISYMDSSSKK